MALIPCPECQKEVSSVALACPQCAFPYPGRQDQGNGRLPGSLKTCPDCQRIISRQVQACPHCGAPASEIDGTLPSSTMETGEERWVSPNCGVSSARPGQVTVPVESDHPPVAGEEKGLNDHPGASPASENPRTGEELPDDHTPPVGRKRKKNPLWEGRTESYREVPRRSRPSSRSPKRWTGYTFVILMVLVSVLIWVVLELRDMSGLEALVHWNR